MKSQSSQTGNSIMEQENEETEDIFPGKLGERKWSLWDFMC